MFESGFDFLKSKVARRFCILFLLCAFLPTIGIVYFSYKKITSQIEQQSVVRLKRDATAYGFALFDRMIRINNELQLVGRAYHSSNADTFAFSDDQREEFADIFKEIAIYKPGKPLHPLYNTITADKVIPFISAENLKQSKPFVLTITNPHQQTEIYFGYNLQLNGVTQLTTISQINPAYLWGLGASPLLPPQTELSIFDKTGQSIIASDDGMAGKYQDYERHHPYKEMRVFQYIKNGKLFLASSTNLFIESHFQETGWLIILSQAQADIMAPVAGFSSTFPFVILLFLLVILYLSIMFIRKGLQPLEKLKEGTKRIAKRQFATKVEITSNDEFQELGNAFNDMAEKLDKQFSTMSVLGEIDRAILSSLERPKVIATTLQRLKEFYKCDLCILAKNSDSAIDHVKIYKLEGRRLSDPTIEYYVLNPEDPELLFDGTNHKILKEQSPRPDFFQQASGERLSDYLCLPLSVDGKVNRSLILGWRRPHISNEDELNQIRKIADQLAIALSNSLHLENLEKLAMGTIEALARTVDAKSKWTAGHSERVAVLGGRIGKRLGLSEKQLDTVSRGGLLHDIGKIGIPLAILDKPDRLDDREYQEIKTHPAIGGKILEPIKAFQDILPVVTQHHEHFDGTGYPDGLAGAQIDIRARILAVADVWDALVSDRPYRGGWVKERAKKLIIEGSGTHFDPQVVDAFLAVMAQE